MVTRRTAIRSFLAAGVGSLLLTCALFAQQAAISTDFDPGFSFNKVKSYSYGKIEATDPLVEPRITAAIDRVMQGYGFKLVNASKNPDVIVSAVNATGRSGQYATFYANQPTVVWKRSWSSGGFSDTIASLNDIPDNTLIIDMYASDRLVWRGMATAPAHEKERKNEDAMDKGVASLLSRFPPRKPGEKMPPNQQGVPDSASSSTQTTTH